jgi:hypothetical protein
MYNICVCVCVCVCVFLLHCHSCGAFDMMDSRMVWPSYEGNSLGDRDWKCESHLGAGKEV